MPCLEITGGCGWRSCRTSGTPANGIRGSAARLYCRLLFLWFLAGLLATFVPPAWAGGSTPSQIEWATSSEKLAPGDALALDYRPVRHEVLNLGPLRGAIWLRVTIDGSEIGNDRWLSVRWPYFRDFRIYLIGPPGMDGESTLLELRQSSLPKGLLAIPNDPGRLLPVFEGEREFLIHLRSDGPAALRVTLGSLDEERTLTLIRYLLFGVYFGAMLGMAVYSLFLMLAVRERTYLGYAAFLASTVLYIGLRFNIITPLLPRSLQVVPSTELAQMGVALMALSSAWFVRRFLRTPRDDRTMDYLLVGIMVAALLSVPASIWLSGLASFLFVASYAIVTLLVAVWASWRAFRRGFRPALHLLVGWAVFAVAVLLYMSMLFGLLPYTTWLSACLPVGSLAQALLLAFALGSRIRHKQREDAMLERERDRYRFLSEQDGLTGLFNRRALDRRLEHAVAAALRDETPLSVIVLDTDCFKDYNDRYGHLAGDDALRCLARVMRANVRHEDMCFRYGGEEFVILLPGQNSSQALVMAERIREAYRNGSASEFGPGGTVSLGVAEFREGDTGNTLLARGDAALYHAKEQGRDRVELAR